MTQTPVTLRDQFLFPLTEGLGFLALQTRQGTNRTAELGQRDVERALHLSVGFLHFAPERKQAFLRYVALAPIGYAVCEVEIRKQEYGLLDNFGTICKLPLPELQ